MRTKVLILAGAVALALVLSASPAAATLVSVFFEDGPQDPLFLPQVVDELGIGAATFPPGPFPDDEEIMAFEMTTDYTPCSEPGNQDSAAIPNMEVTMTNLTTRDFADVWYVADLDTGLTNFDGTVNLGHAFKIDTLGFNRPLITESFFPLNDIFEAGETWHFVIQDYTNGLGLPASLLSSVGVGVGSLGLTSTGSIVAIPVPEPGTVMMFFGAGLMGLVALARRRKKA